MSEALEQLKQINERYLNISYDSEDMIIDLGLYLEEHENKEIEVYYKIIEDGIPIYVDYLTPEEKAEVGVEDDLKELSCVNMTALEALELFKYQNQIIKK